MFLAFGDRRKIRVRELVLIGDPRLQFPVDSVSSIQRYGSLTFVP